MRWFKCLLICFMVLFPFICKGQPLSDKEKAHYKLVMGRSTLDSLSMRNDSLALRLYNLQDSLISLNAEIAELDALCRNHPFAEDYRTDSLITALAQESEQLASLALSEIKLPVIERFLSKCRSVSGNPKVAGYMRQFENVRSYKELYDRADFLMNNTYDEIALSSFERDLKAVSEGRREDKYLKVLNDISDKLYYYPDAVYYFSEIIKEIEVIKNDAAYASALAQVLSDNKSYIEYFIDEIPYLKIKFEKYRKDLLDSPERKSEVPDEIKKML